MKILLIIPPFAEIYKGSKVRAGVPGSPLLGIAAIAGILLKANCDVRILDMNIPRFPLKELDEIISSFEPQIVGITTITPLFVFTMQIAEYIKKLRQNILLIAGGPHASSMPEETLKNSVFDVVVMGEGDFIIDDIIQGRKMSEIKGISYKENGSIKINPPAAVIHNLDLLPLPAWHLYNIKEYKSPKFMAKDNPSGWIETSRGCPFSCCYCNKSVFGYSFRAKSHDRVCDEIKYMLKIGFKEIHIADDMFTTDVDRVKKLCELIIKNDLKFRWATVTGIRVDRGDQEMFNLMKKAGCYRVYFGIESGNQAILDNIGKNITIEKVRNAVGMAKKSGMETCGYFMLGLPGETRKTMEDTIAFSTSLELDWAKASIMVPLPATRIYNELDKAGKIKTKNWTHYNLYMPANKIYEHSNLSWEQIEKYFNLFYRKFYFRPGYIVKRLIKGIADGTIFSDIMCFFQTRW